MPEGSATPALRLRDLRSLDLRVTAVLLVGALILPFHAVFGRHVNSIPGLDGRSYEVCYGLIPFLALAVLGYNPLRYLGPGRWREVLPWFLAFALVITASLFWLATVDSWKAYYGSAWGPNWSYLGSLLLTMLAGEFFFRGFLILPLVERFGWYAVPIATLPYVAIHAGKPSIEIYGSVVFGLGLGYLAVRSGSIWYGTLLHWLVNAVIPIAGRIMA